MKQLSCLLRRTRSRLAITAHRASPSQPIFEALLPKSPELKNRLVEFVKKVNGMGGSYHRLDFGSGIFMDGEYDMTKYLDHYGIPQDLTGKSILDIGTGSGFFTLECIRRGGQVTAIDLWDPAYYQQLQAALGVDFRYVQKNIYDVDATFGQFDLIICGSVLLHLRDLFGAIERIRSVCKGEAIISTALLEDSQCVDKPYCEFVGMRTTGGAGEYWVYWHLNTMALRSMLLAAGFSVADEVGQFVLESEPEKSGFAEPHVVVKAII